MRTITQQALIVLAAFAAIATPSPAHAQPKIPTKRFSGKITRVDAKTKSITLEDKTVVSLTDKTKLNMVKSTNSVTFKDLAVGDAILGIEHTDPASGGLVADSLTIGIARTILDAPEHETFIAPTNAPVKPKQG